MNAEKLRAALEVAADRFDEIEADCRRIAPEIAADARKGAYDIRAALADPQWRCKGCGQHWFGNHPGIHGKIVGDDEKWTECPGPVVEDSGAEGMKSKLNLGWTCCNLCHSWHRWKWQAWLHHKWIQLSIIFGAAGGQG